MTKRLLDHIDLRVDDLEKCAPFYHGLLPLLGFTEDAKIDGWIQYVATHGDDDIVEFFGVTEDRNHIPNGTRIAFRAADKETVDRIASRLPALGALAIEGPDYEADFYYAVYFNDPAGNQLELCHRTKN